MVRKIALAILIAASALAGCLGPHTSSRDTQPTENPGPFMAAIPRPIGGHAYSVELENESPGPFKVTGTVELSIPARGGICAAIGVGTNVYSNVMDGGSAEVAVAGDRHRVTSEPWLFQWELDPPAIPMAAKTELTVILMPSEHGEPFEVAEWDLTLTSDVPFKLGSPRPVEARCLTRISGFDETEAIRAGGVGATREAVARAQFEGCSFVGFSVASGGSHHARLRGPGGFDEVFESRPPTGQQSQNRLARASEAGEWNATVEHAVGRTVEARFYAWEIPCA